MGGLKYTVSELEQILSVGVDGIKNDRQLKGRMLQYGMYIFGQLGCTTCNEDIAQLYSNLKNNGMSTLKNKIERNFELKNGFVGQMSFGSQQHLSNANLTDELALEFLSINPERIKCFETFPKNWQKLVTDFVASLAEKKAQEAKQAKEAKEKAEIEKNAQQKAQIEKIVDDKLAKTATDTKQAEEATNETIETIETTETTEEVAVNDSEATTTTSTKKSTKK